ncbi:MAG: glycosyltransferase family 2 protein [Bacteroidetes bacterium]|nr:glycosyltransferase family 2 protein [Bacteroidota bacterium]
MTKISAVIITFNEEENIGRCIDSLKSIVDEIIVVDSRSTDNTASICKEKGAYLVETDWMGYSATKNYANSLAVYPYILSIDADEVLSETLQQSVLTVKKNPLFDAYYINRMTNYCGHWLKHLWYPDKKVRLFQKEKAEWSGAPVHEELIFKSKSRIGLLKGDLLHYSFPTIDKHFATSRKYSIIKAQQSLEKGEKVTFFKVLFAPISKFISEYLFKKGFMDGYYGFVACSVSAMAAFVKYIRLHELNRNTRS